MADEVTTPDTTAAEPELSLEAHEQQFGKGAPSAVDDQQDTSVGAADADAGTAAVSETPARDDKGRFQKGDRQRAKSQQASREDVPRIQELTRRLREAEAERDALKSRPSGAPSSPTVSVPPVQSAPVPAVRQTPLVAEPEPTPEDKNADGTPKFTTYEEYLRALRVYDRQQIFKELQDRQEKAERQAREQAEQTRVITDFQSRLPAARERHADFDEHALNRPTRIPQGSLIDRWILEHAAGAEILYHLQTHDAELDTMLAMPLLEQVDTLSLLGQRLTSSDQRNARTGAVAARPSITPVPRPPTPVRTGPVRAAEEPPDADEDRSLAEHEKFFGRSRERR